MSKYKSAAFDFLYTDTNVAMQREKLQGLINTNTESMAACTKQLLVDISVIIKGDARTGIQRVVRAILSELLASQPEGYMVRPVFANEQHAYCHVPLEFNLAKGMSCLELSQCNQVNAMHGDVFLALDLVTQQLPKHQKQLECWKRNGASIHVLVYDLLPVLHPEWFHSRTTKNFYRWLRTLAVIADSAICISNSVKADLAAWLEAKYAISSKSLPIKVISMGCDLEASVPSQGLPKEAALLLERFAGAPSALMLGTLEPRKGHKKVLIAFENLWQQGSPYQLIIVGKPGWKTKPLQKMLNNHPELGKRLFWLDNVSDEYLNQIYHSIYGLIVASEGEGFGLPIVEAAKHGKPVLVRDLPVFREHNSLSMHFSDDRALPLSRVINEWFRKPLVPADQIHQHYTIHWRDTVKELLSLVDIALKKDVGSMKRLVGVQ